jgi:hypothetical protein
MCIIKNLFAGILFCAFCTFSPILAQTAYINVKIVNFRLGNWELGNTTYGEKFETKLCFCLYGRPAGPIHNL